MGSFSTSHWLIVLAIVVLLFGAKKIPDLAKSIGQGIKGFKKEMRDEDEPTVSSTPEAQKHVESTTTTSVETPKTTTQA
ncbi:MAG: twin-arginine translocase TatA/TatE family subunit [Sulfuricurvum sp.]